MNTQTFYDKLLYGGAIALLTNFLGCAQTKPVRIDDSAAAIQFGLERNDNINSLFPYEVDAIADALLNKKQPLTKEEKLLAYNLGHRTIQILNQTLLGPVFGQRDRMDGRDVPVSLGSDGKIVYAKFGEERIVEYFSKALNCFVLSENSASRKDLEFIITNIKNRNTGRIARIQRVYDKINQQFSSAMQQAVQNNGDSEETLDFIVDCMTAKFAENESPKSIIDEFSKFLPRTRKAGNAVLRMLSERYVQEGFLQYFVSKGFNADKPEIEKYSRKIISFGGALDDLLFIHRHYGRNYGIEVDSQLPVYAERVLSRNNANDYHSGVIALEQAKKCGIVLPDRIFAERIGKDVNNFEMDIADIALFHEIYGRNVNYVLTERFRTILDAPITVKNIAECVKTAAVMAKYDHPEFQYAFGFAVKSFELPTLGKNRKIKNLRTKTSGEGIDFVSEKEVIYVLASSPNSAFYLGFARDIIYESGKIKLFERHFN